MPYESGVNPWLITDTEELRQFIYTDIGYLRKRMSRPGQDAEWASEACAKLTRHAIAKKSRMELLSVLQAVQSMHAIQKAYD